MADEARVLVIFQRAQDRLKEVLEMPDQDANRIIRSIKENGWVVSGKLKKGYPQLEDERMAERIVEAVRSAFEDREMGGRRRVILRRGGLTPAKFSVDHPFTGGTKKPISEKAMSHTTLGIVRTLAHCCAFVTRLIVGRRPNGVSGLATRRHGAEASEQFRSAFERT